MDNNSSTGSGIGSIELLTIVFITLKLCGVIKWSWLWVLSPIWIALGISILLIAIGLGCEFYTKIKDEK